MRVVVVQDLDESLDLVVAFDLAPETDSAGDNRGDVLVYKGDDVRSCCCSRARLRKQAVGGLVVARVEQ